MMTMKLLDKNLLLNEGDHDYCGTADTTGPYFHERPMLYKASLRTGDQPESMSYLHSGD